MNAEPDITVVGEAATTAEAFTRLPRSDADVAVLDARLPDGGGIDVCRETRSTLPDTRCLILTSLGGVVRAVRPESARTVGNQFRRE